MDFFLAFSIHCSVLTAHLLTSKIDFNGLPVIINCPMSIFKKKKKNRACVVGLDGVPYSLLLELARKDIMPETSKLIASGHLHRMKASLPEISAVSWTDFMTGSNSGGHGIFGFTDFKPGSYEIRFPNFLDVKKETLWDILGAAGKKCVIINQPSTYPARRVNGILISGFVAVEMSRAVFPLVSNLLSSRWVTRLTSTL